VVRKYGNQMEHMDCMLGGGGAQILVFRLFQWLLWPYDVIMQNNSICQCYSAFTVNSEWVSIPLQAQRNFDHLSMILVML